MDLYLSDVHWAVSVSSNPHIAAVRGCIPILETRKSRLREVKKLA